MAASLLTISFITNLVLSMAEATEQPFDACEVYHPWNPAGGLA